MDYKTEQIVTKVLENSREARNSDGILYIKVCEEIFGGDISKLTLYDVLMSGEFPPTETVRRTRQKVQEIRKDLASDRTIQKWRKQQEQRYREYARS